MAQSQASGREDSGSGTIIPMGSSSIGGNTIFPHLLDAVSQIQQFYIIESKGKAIPNDFLTIRGKLNFFNIGFGAGFIEALIFMFLLCLILPMISDPDTRVKIAGYFPPIQYDAFIWLITLIPVLISGILCSYMSRYHIGQITKKAVDMLLLGRLCSLCAKGLLLFFILIFISNRITPESAWIFSKYATFKKYHLAVKMYDVILNLKPLLVQRAFATLVIFGVAMVMPFLTIWGVDWYRKFVELRNKEIMEK